MNLSPRISTVAFLLLLLPVQGDPPAWWQEGSPPVIDPAATPNNHGPANIGQAKYMAKQALDKLSTLEPALAAEILEKLTQPQPNPSDPGQPYPAIVDFSIPGDPLPADWQARQHAPLMIGQLKAISAPFYERLHTSAPAWLTRELILNQTLDAADPANFYPWTSATHDDATHAIATIGQLKAVLSLRLETLDTDDDGLADAWERTYFSNLDQTGSEDADGDGLANSLECIHGTNPLIADSDHDGMNDGWEILGGLDPLNQADATADSDGDHVSNLREYQVGTCPTGIYRIEVLPIDTYKFFHSATDDGSVVVQESMNATSSLRLVTAPDTNGNRSLVPFPPDVWNPLDAIVANLVTNGRLNSGESLIPTSLTSSDGTLRVFQTNTARLLLKAPGSFLRSLAPDVAWHAINNYGDAVGTVDRYMPAANGMPAHPERELRVCYGYYTNIIPMPDTWLTPTPSIPAFSDAGDVLVRRPITLPDGTTRDEHYLLKPYQNVFTLVKQPGLAGETIVALSPNNARMLGNGPQPFQITPDGIPLLLTNLQIQNSPSETAVPLASLYPNTLLPNHISSDGRITLTTTDTSNQTTILQLVPNNDTDRDNMPDDWERSFARTLLDYNNSPDYWGAAYADLAAGNLNPTTDYTSDQITAGEVESLSNHLDTWLPGDGIIFDCVGRRNILGWGQHDPANDHAPERNIGLYYYENTGRSGDSFDIKYAFQLEPQFLDQQILSNPWERGAAYNFSRFAHYDHVNHTEYEGEVRQQKKRLLADKPSAVDRSRIYLLITRRTTYNTPSYPYVDEITDIKCTTLKIPKGKITSDWIELSSRTVDGYEYSKSLVSFGVAVDANRDNTITFDTADQTTQGKPFRFWINNDQDDLASGESVLDDPNNSDLADYKIKTVRDLEDFCRLSVDTGLYPSEMLRNGDFKIGLKFINATAQSPRIRVWANQSNSGNRDYLLDETAAALQIKTDPFTESSNGEILIPQSYWDSHEGSIAHLIFEGTRKGAGELVVTIQNKDGVEIGESSGTWIHLLDVKEMYHRNIGNRFVEPPTDSESKEALTFVHGWNMSPDGSSVFAETMYKRMWHKGFNGRFSFFRWDTNWSDAFDNVPAVGTAVEAYFADYNGSEFTAWKSGAALKQYVESMPSGYARKLVAHSMGNVVAGSALRLNLSVQNYALLQAAVPASCYDETQNIKETKQYTLKITGLPDPTMWDENPTPDHDYDPLAYRGQFKHFTGALTSFYQEKDSATSYAWELNNDLTKYPGFIGAQCGYYGRYDNNLSAGSRCIKEIDYILFSWPTVITDPYEARSYVCRTWGKAVGAQGKTRGSIDAWVDNDASYGFSDEHSAEFNRPIQKLGAFYDELKKTLRIQTP